MYTVIRYGRKWAVMKPDGLVRCVVDNQAFAEEICIDLNNERCLSDKGKEKLRAAARKRTDAFTMCRPVIGPGGKRYHSLAQAADETGISEYMITKRSTLGINGWRFDDVTEEDLRICRMIKKKTSGNARPVIGPDGTFYQSIRDAIDATGLDHATIRRRCTAKAEGWRFANEG